MDSFNSEEFKLNAKQQQLYTCDLCAATYTHKKTLGYHLDVHSGRVMYYIKEEISEGTDEDQHVKPEQNADSNQHVQTEQNADSDQHVKTEHKITDSD